MCLYTMTLKLIHQKKRAKDRKMYLLETSVNSLISEDDNFDEEDNAVGHSSKDNSNNNGWNMNIDIVINEENTTIVVSIIIPYMKCGSIWAIKFDLM